jgi:hypothetical protein
LEIGLDDGDGGAIADFESSDQVRSNANGVKPKQLANS